MKNQILRFRNPEETELVYVSILKQQICETNVIQDAFRFSEKDLEIKAQAIKELQLAGVTNWEFIDEPEKEYKHFYLSLSITDPMPISKPEKKEETEVIARTEKECYEWKQEVLQKRIDDANHLQQQLREQLDATRRRVVEVQNKAISVVLIIENDTKYEGLKNNWQFYLSSQNVHTFLELYKPTFKPDDNFVNSGIFFCEVDARHIHEVVVNSPKEWRVTMKTTAFMKMVEYYYRNYFLSPEDYKNYTNG